MAATACSEAEFAAATEGCNGVVAYFWASWAPMCTQTDQLCDRLVAECKNVKFIKIDADKGEDLTEKFDVESVPAFVFIQGGEKVGFVVGPNAPEISKKATELDQAGPKKACSGSKCGGCPKQSCSSRGTENEATAPPGDLNSRLKALTEQKPVMLFMKGAPGAEKCGFSRTIVGLLKEQGVEFGHFDILGDEEVRQGLKEYSKWPTFPQLYAKGKLIGGLDIIKELIEEDELKSSLGLDGTSADLSTRLKALTEQKPVMLFMKGAPGAEKCGFSRTIVGLLKEQGVEFGHFDILGDEEVRQGLKEYSKWPTFPQLYAKGKLIGGLDIIKELIEEDELKSSLGLDGTSADLSTRLKALTEQKPVMLFMKGAPGAEKCGFSRTIVGLLKEQGVEFGHFDILGDEEVRQGLKEYSKWPTYPQLYAKGKLIGGLDIIKELIEEDELKSSLGM